MGRIDERFESLRAEGRKALVIYLTAGDPDFDGALDAALAAVESGADVLEVGVPFSDPVADGPVIQEAMCRALDAGGGLSQSLELVRRVREKSSIPIVLFGYFNPLLWWGFEESARRIAEAGADGLLVVDLPPEEAGPFKAAAREHGLDWVSLAAPTSGSERVASIAANATGFLYLVSMTGVTGGALSDTRPVESMIEVARGAANIPACVGFGVRDAESAKRLGAIADGVVVGSEIVRVLRRGVEEKVGARYVGELVQNLRRALDEGTSAGE